MERKLNSVGKACFVKYYSQFANLNVSNFELVETLHKENGYTVKACQTRVSKARSLIEDGCTCSALKIIISSNRLGSNTVEEAQKIYSEICLRD